MAVALAIYLVVSVVIVSRFPPEWGRAHWSTRVAVTLAAPLAAACAFVYWAVGAAFDGPESGSIEAKRKEG